MTRNVASLLLWHQGMMLSPQHLQQMSLRYEGLIPLYAQLANPYFWGIDRMTIDQQALISGVFRVNQLSAIMPDGLWIDYDYQHSEVDLVTNFSESLQGANRIKIHLCISQTISNQPNARYTPVMTPPVADLFNPNYKVSYKQLEPNIRLVAGAEQPVGSISFAIAEIEVVDGVSRLSQYIPPMLRMTRTNPLGLKVNQLLESIREKSGILEHRLLSSDEDDQVMVDSYRLKYTLNNIYGELSYLDAYSKHDVAHPFDIYLAFYSILVRLSSHIQWHESRQYRHEDIEGSLSAVCDTIMDALNLLIPLSKTMLIPVDANNRFVLPKQYINFDEPIVLGVRNAEGLSKTDLDLWLSKILIASEDKLDAIEHTRTQGALRHFVKSSDEYGIITTTKVMIFHVEQDRKSITKDKDVIVVNFSSSIDRIGIKELFLYTKRVE